jgi:translation initiation factor 5A
MCDLSVDHRNSEISSTFEASSSVGEDIKDRIVHGRDVEYWKVLDRIKIVRIKG